MIDLIPIIELSSSIELAQQSMDQLSKPFIAISALSIIGGIVGGCTMPNYGKKYYSLFLLCLVPFLIIGIQGEEWNERTGHKQDLMNERQTYYDEEVGNAKCDDLRLHILNVYENEQIKYIKDDLDRMEKIYDYKCQTPLEVEIIE